MLNLEEDSLSVNQVKGLLQMNCKYKLCYDIYAHYAVSHPCEMLSHIHVVKKYVFYVTFSLTEHPF